MDMSITITEFRRDLFNLVDRVIAGETIEFRHRGTTIRLVVPESRSSRLDRLTPRQVTNPKMTNKEQRAAEKRMRAEMFAEIERDWAEL